MGFPPKGPSVTQRIWEVVDGLPRSPHWHWSSCMSYVSPTSRAVSTKQGMEIDQGFLPMAVLKCRFPGSTQDPLLW